jgi:hypothetical protein
MNNPIAPTLCAKQVCALCCTIALLCANGFAAANIEKLIFEEQRIEGKIRRPQLVLIQADERPVFEPMALESFGRGSGIIKSVNRRLIEASPYNGPFEFNNYEITNIKQ